uniref:CLAVATA3/ESR (CLE)-related protein n=1 Tax=Meloidogyne floridensis TaxID=298350 RepID=A0A915PAA0_9BILA
MKSTTFQFIFLLIIGIQLIYNLNNVDGANEQEINVDKIKGNNNGDGGSLLNEDYAVPGKKPPDHNP